ncbi:TPA: glycosyltransferase, partial [Candidatus Bathyarchaeota archaeon]|nr:glycosyltransferase [Candidatus Bathyarchaeota archaeon]
MISTSSFIQGVFHAVVIKEHLQYFRWMKISFVNHTFLSGSGPDKVILELSKRLATKHDIKIFACKWGDPGVYSAPCVYPFGYPVPLPSPRLLKELNEFDVVNIHFYPFCIYAPFLRSPVVLTFHGWTDFPETEISSIPWAGRLIAMDLLKIPAKRCLLILSVSHYLADKVRNISKTIVIPNGVDLSLYRPGEDGGYVLFVGRLVRYKSVHELIWIMTTMRMELHIVGRGPELDRLKKLTEDLGVEKRVRFLGTLPEQELVKEYRNCSFLASASKWEGFGMPFLEANACA